MGDVIYIEEYLWNKREKRQNERNNSVEEEFIRDLKEVRETILEINKYKKMDDLFWN